MYTSSAEDNVTFEIIKTYTVTTNVGEGVHTDVTNVTLEEGDGIEIKFTVDEGYNITDVKVNGVSIGVTDVYIIKDISKDYIIEVIASKKETVQGTVATGEADSAYLYSGMFFVATAFAAVALRIFKRKKETL